MRDVRPVAAVPGWVLGLLGAALAAQIAWQALRESSAAPRELGPAPGAHGLRLASFAEAEVAARLAMVHVQSFQKPDYAQLIDWLRSALEVDPRSQYPLFLAARVYAETGEAARSRAALEFVHQEFLRDPNRRWPWLAHAALLAKHRLKDLPLARRYAQELERHVTARGVPLWARQMEIFILEDMNELQAARIMLGGLIQSGAVEDPAELRFLKQRLEELESRAR
jgi:tetratricopeptide (TPR) repeat protein